ncbi:MAG: AraC family transcriptional regulator [Firmicutes bacterium]|nr:AraC family transcriptional regulator [Bacillota bacterium]
MRTIDKLNAVIDYVENHISEDIDLNHLAAIACSSLYDFQRMFGFIAEMSIVEYIRKRRLTLAGLELRQGKASVLTVAIKYNYNSPVSFARAFQAFHGIVPSKVKSSGVPLQMFPRIFFQVTVKEVPIVLRRDIIVVNGKEYEASYFGEVDISAWSKDYSKREFWRLEDVYGDFKDLPETGQVLPYNNYPINVEIGQVFVIDYLRKKDGLVERKYYIADGTVWKDLPSTREFRPGHPGPTPPLRMDKITVNGKEYDASYFGSRDMSSWSELYVDRDFWRLENAYDDFKDNPGVGGSVLPYNNYPMHIEIGQVFVIDYQVKIDGSIERKFYISDGTVWQDMPSTREVLHK